MKKFVIILLLALFLTTQAFIPESSFTPIIYQGSSPQTQWNNANRNSSNVQRGTNSIAAINNNDLKTRQLNRNEASLMDKAKANINNSTTLNAEQKQQASADLNALACAAVQCAAGVSANDPLYEQVRQLQAQGEALKAKGEDIVSSLGVHGVEVKAADNDFAYSRLDQMDDLITSHEQTVARAGQITQGVAGAAEAAGGVALSGTGLGAVIGVPLAGLGAYDMADASDKLGTPHTYQSGQNVLNSFSTETHPGDISPTKDAAIDLGINAALTVGATKIAKHADDIGDYVGGVFKKGSGIQNQNRTETVPNNTGDFVDLSDPKRRTHILEGDSTGGGHRAGTGYSGKTEFPQGWTDDRIMHEISDIATDPSSNRRNGRGGRTITEGTRDGVDIRVIQEKNGEIVTGFPTNLPRNDK